MNLFYITYATNLAEWVIFLLISVLEANVRFLVKKCKKYVKSVGMNLLKVYKIKNLCHNLFVSRILMCLIRNDLE